MTDSEVLLASAREGDIEAFSRLFEAFRAELQSYIYRLLTNRADAEDLTHDTFLRAFEKLDSFRGESSLKTWVFSIATNLCMDILRKRKRWPVDAQDQSRATSIGSPEITGQYLSVNQNSTHGTYEVREHIDFCFTCISKTLPIEQQVALMLKDVYGFKVKEVSAILGTTLGAAKHLLHNARTTMTRIFKDRCSLVNKNGICYQCSELNGFFNPEQDTQVELMKVELARAASDRQDLFELRTRLVQSIDPLNASGTDLHDFIMQRVRRVINDTDDSAG